MRKLLVIFSIAISSCAVQEPNLTTPEVWKYEAMTYDEKRDARMADPRYAQWDLYKIDSKKRQKKKEARKEAFIYYPYYYYPR